MNAGQLVKKYDLGGRTWIHKGFHAKFHYYFPVNEMPLGPLRDYFGDSFELTVSFLHDDYLDWYWNYEDMVRLRDAFIEWVHQRPAALDDLVSEWRDRIAVFDRITETIDRTNLQKLEDKELSDLYGRFYVAYTREYALAATFQEGFSLTAEEFLVPHFKKIITAHGEAEKADEYYFTLVAPIDRSFINQEYYDRLCLLEDYKRGKDITPMLVEHARKYHWLQNNYAIVRNLDESYFRSQLDEIRDLDSETELSKQDAQLAEAKKKKKELIEKLGLDQRSWNLLRITEVFAYMQDERKKYVLIANYYQRKFLEEYARRLDTPLKELEYSYFYEVVKLLEGKAKIDTNVFRERKKSCLLIYTLQGYEVLTGDVVEEVFKKLFEEEESITSELSGTVASKGTARGTARLVLKVDDIQKVKRGDILISSMTRPEMVVAMKRAAAIVTDEGGITSHAAVVSRELGIPCVINTKRATRLFKDGDVVEVDANTGVVRKI